MIQGFYRKKIRVRVTSVNDFINKMIKADILKNFLS